MTCRVVTCPVGKLVDTAMAGTFKTPQADCVSMCVASICIADHQSDHLSGHVGIQHASPHRMQSPASSASVDRDAECPDGHPGGQSDALR